MSYIEEQRRHQISLIESGRIFNGAEGGAEYAGTPRPYILLEGKDNLYPECAGEVLEYFEENKIQWWQLEQGAGKPSGHVLSSQVACVNHLFPLRRDKEGVLGLLKTIDMDFTEALPIELEGGYIAFEGVCAGDYLNEGSRTRGANSTSVDALVIGRKWDGMVVLVLIEWKYTEHYTVGDKQLSDINLTQWKRYSGLIESSKYLKNIHPELYYTEPFYQLMRQTLWGEQMVAHEYAGSTGFINIHVIPEKNVELLKSGNHGYKINGREGSLTGLWREQLHIPELYRVMTPEELLRNQPDGDWKKYLEVRYWQ